MPKWTAEDLPDLTDRTVVITGANSGIGLVAARELAGAGAHVVLAVRDLDRGRAAAGTISGSTEVRLLDLADQASVRRFAEGFNGDIDILINNAGIMAVPYRVTVDGFESQFGTNHLGHFALTGLLLERIKDRVVTVSSTAHKPGRINFEDLQWEKSYNPWVAYSQSKLANLLFTAELQRRLEASASPVRALAAHPGWSATNLQSHTGSRIQSIGMSFGNKLLAQSDKQGALPTLYAATQDLPGNSYIGPDGPFEVRGHPKLVDRTDRAKDADVAKRLWEVSESLTGISYA